MLGLLGLVMWLGCIVCFVIVLIKLFQTDGALMGILGLICALYTFIWGWLNASKLNLRNIMMIWTLLIILSIIINVAGGGFHYSYGSPTP
ncbi:MAG: hypothetical protein QOH41_1296 [Blastocatellia bacterium]|jgi:hypothetical protein|nr:hypothetical protein [Blastocatellia bacterium]MDX6529006.1 hypothetical protein [Blastocatellia bacterium]